LKGLRLIRESLMAETTRVYAVNLGFPDNSSASTGPKLG
jgi:hypothetical protein